MDQQVRIYESFAEAEQNSRRGTQRRADPEPSGNSSTYGTHLHNSRSIPAKGKTSNRPTGSELLVTDKPARVPRYYFALITCHDQVLETQAGSGNGGRATLSHASPISTYLLMATRVLYKGRARKVIARASRRLATTLQAHVE